MIVCCRRCGNVMSLDSGDGMYHCPNCNAVMPAWSVPQQVTRLATSESRHQPGDPVPNQVTN